LRGFWGNRSKLSDHPLPVDGSELVDRYLPTLPLKLN
jgi:hypothetical protein